MSGYLVATTKIRPSSLYYADISARVSVISIIIIENSCLLWSNTGTGVF